LVIICVLVFEFWSLKSVKLNTTIHKGGRDKPVAILIHGLGVDKGIWVDPVHTKLLARNIPLRVVAAKEPHPHTSTSRKKITIGDLPDRIDNLWSELKEEGYNLMTWSQKRPVGPVDVAVAELNEMLLKAEELFPGLPVALIGHSRGGLIARKFIKEKNPEIKALVTIASPHHGSSVSKLARHLTPLAAVLKGILPREKHSKLIMTIKNTTDFLTGEALKELMPGSDFLKNMRDSKKRGIKYLSFGGTEPRLLTIYRWSRKGEKIYPEPLMDIPDSLIKVFPSSLRLDEVTPGKGDSLVSAESSLMPWSARHYDVPENHISIMWNEKVIEKTIELLSKL
jgi:pimeloyl-ACP methyl ester carboxylesterase